MRVNNNPGLKFAALVLGGLALGATVLRGYDVQNDLSYWPVGNVNWEAKLVGNGVNIPIPSVGTPLTDGSTSWGAALQKVIDQWNAVIPNEVLTLSITPNSSIDPVKWDDVNNVGFAQKVYTDDWGSGVVGVSISRNIGNKRTDNDVLFNANETWNAYDGPKQGSVVDLKRIGLHEFGHSLGLDHPDQAGQVVNAIMNSVSGDLYQLQQDDIDGVMSLYGSIRPLAITRQPQDYTVPAGGTWTATVTVTGSELITYAWEYSLNGGATWTTAGGVDTATIIYSSLSSGQNGMKLRATMTNPAGSLMSDVATLTVTASGQDPVFTTQPVDASGDVGASVMFTVAATGSPTPTYQWQYSSNGGSTWSDVNDGPVLPAGYNYSGATTGTLTISSLASGANNRKYRAVAKNNYSGADHAATSNAVTLTVNGVVTAPAITTDPVSKSVYVGDPVSFTVAATGTAPLTYQWKKDTVNIGGATSATFNIASAAEADAGSYTCVVTNSAGSATSAAAMLTVDLTPIAPAITTQPADLSVSEGAMASFSVVATGTALTYQWKKDGVAIGGATSPTYSIASAMIGDEGVYSVSVSNTVGSVASADAMLTVVVPPAITMQPASKAVAANGPVSFTVVATGSATLAYQWRKDGGDISGATSATYTIGNVTTGSAGTYSVVVSNSAGSVTSAGATLTVDTTARLINLSTLTKAGSGNATLTVGFYIGGTGKKTLIIRGIGPSLVGKGVPDPVVDPQLKLYSSNSTLLDQNDDWDPALAPDFAAVGAFALDANSKDAALKVTLDAGKSYSVQLINTGTAAKAIIELYDFSRDAASRLTNLSCRLNVESGQVVTVGTFMLNGTKSILMRASGPGLAYALPTYFTPADVLPDPKQDLFKGNVVTDSNEDWDSALKPYFNAVGAFGWEDGSKDSALRVPLSTGGYTIQATGHGGSGTALIEFYESP